MISLAVIEAMVEAGCTAHQVLAALRADHAERQRRRAERAGLRLGNMNEPDSGVRFADEQTGRSSPLPSPVSAPSLLGEGRTGKGSARVALLMMPELPPAARRVGAVLIEHHNLKTGRCDPGITGIAKRTGLDERSVRRAIGQLEARGLVARTLHGGRSHRNAYEIDWTRLAELASAAETQKLNEADSGANRTLWSAEPDSGVRQNLTRKPHIQSEDVASQRATSPPRPDPQQPQFLYAMSGGKSSVSKADAAYGSAGARLWRDLKDHTDDGERTRLFDAAMSEPARLDRATVAEMRRRGAGKVLLLGELSTGPPASAVG